MRIIFFLSLILFSCSTTKWKQKYRNEYFARIRKQYADKDGNLSFAYAGSRIPNKEPSRSDSLTSHWKSYDVTNYSKKELKQRMQGFEWAAAVYPDSIKSDNGRLDSIYLNPYKIRYIQHHHLKTPNKIFVDTIQLRSNAFINN